MLINRRASTSYISWFFAHVFCLLSCLSHVVVCLCDVNNCDRNCLTVSEDRCLVLSDRRADTCYIPGFQLIFFVYCGVFLMWMRASVMSPLLIGRFRLSVISDT